MSLPSQDHQDALDQLDHQEQLELFQPSEMTWREASSPSANADGGMGAVGPH